MKLQKSKVTIATMAASIFGAMISANKVINNREQSIDQAIDDAIDIVRKCDEKILSDEEAGY